MQPSTAIPQMRNDPTHLVLHDCERRIDQRTESNDDIKIIRKLVQTARRSHEAEVSFKLFEAADPTDNFNVALDDVDKGHVST